VNSHSDWYDGISKQITQLKNTLTEKDYKKFKLDFLLCVARRVADFSNECGQCNLLQQEIVTLTQDVDNLVQITSKERRKDYFRVINRITGHLQRHHKLITEGYYIGIMMALGSGIGVAIGVAMDNIGSGIPIGVGIGVAIGAALDAKAKKDGRILCLKVTTGFSKTVIVLIGLGIVLLLGGILAFILLRNSN